MRKPESVAWVESPVLWRLRAHTLASMGGELSEAALDDAIELVNQIDRELKKRGELKDVGEDEE